MQKRTPAIILASLAAAAVFVGLVHAVLAAAHLSEPSATTVYGRYINLDASLFKDVRVREKLTLQPVWRHHADGGQSAHSAVRDEVEILVGGQSGDDAAADRA